jgi:hypothetical protein
MRPPIQRPPDEQWEEAVRRSAGTFAYPATPDMADRVIARLTAGRAGHLRPSPRRLQPAWVIAIILALLIGALAVPPVRAALLEFLQIGSVRIWLAEPTATPVPSPTPPAARTPPVRPAPTPLASIFDLTGETTLAEAEARAGLSIRLPTYPPDLRAPDAVFYQHLGGPVVVLVWVHPERPDEAKMSLHILGEGAMAEKGNPTVVMTTTVNGEMAAWTQGPYVLAYGQGSPPEWQMRQLVSGRVLVWVEDGLTYRLESELPLEEAVRVAESLR